MNKILDRKHILERELKDALLRIDALYAPFKSVDAWQFYLDYSNHLKEFGNAGAKERRDMLWDKAYEELQRQDFQELLDRVQSLVCTRWFEDIINDERRGRRCDDCVAGA